MNKLQLHMSFVCIVVYYIHEFHIHASHLPLLSLEFIIGIMILIFLIQRDTTGLSSENTELKLRLQAMEQQAQLRDGKFSCTFRGFEYFYDSGNSIKPERIILAPI